MKNIYLLDYKGNINKSNVDVLERHRKYGASLRSLSSSESAEIKLVVLGEYGNNTDFISRELDVLNLKNTRLNRTFLMKAHTYLNSVKSRDFALIAGDPWFSTFYARILKLTLRKQIRIESQVHFDFNTFFTLHRWPVGKLLKHLTIWQLRSVNQVRVVDKASLETLKKLLPDKCHVYFAPSLLNINQEYKCSVNEKSIPTLLYAGRLHPERRPDIFVDILRKLHGLDFRFKAVIAGDGLLKSEISATSRNLIDDGLLTFTGELNGDSLYREYCEADVLISCAEEESYGRSLREALYYGAKVLSRSTRGFESLKSEINVNYLASFEPSDPVEILIAKINHLVSQKVDDETRVAFEVSQQEILQTLALRWGNLLST